MKDTDKNRTSATGKVNITQLSSYDRALGRMVAIDTQTPIDNQAMNDLASDCFWQVYKADPQNVDPIPESREFNARMLDWLKKSPTWEANRSDTQGTIFPSALSAGFLYEALITDEALQEALKKEQEAEKARQEAQEAAQAAQNLQDAADQNNDPNMKKQAAQAAANAQQKAGQAQAKSQAAMAALDGTIGKQHSDAIRGKVVKQAQDKTEETMERLAAWGSDPGQVVAGDIKEVMKALNAYKKRGNWIDEITQLMGRVKGTALHAKATQTHQSGIIYGDGYTQSLQNIFPSELALLRPDAPAVLRAEKFAEFADRGLLGLVEGVSEERQGDLIIITDESGSMQGGKIIRAKALALGIAQAAKEGGQEYQIYSFDVSIAQHRVTSADNWAAHLSWAAQFMDGGGTDFDAALECAMDAIEKLPDIRRASCDIVILTDGGSSISDEVQKRFRDMEDDLGTRLVALVVDSDVSEVGLPRVTDRILEVTTDEDMDTITTRLVDALSREENK